MMHFDNLLNKHETKINVTLKAQDDLSKICKRKQKKEKRNKSYKYQKKKKKRSEKKRMKRWLAHQSYYTCPKFVKRGAFYSGKSSRTF